MKQSSATSIFFCWLHNTLVSKVISPSPPVHIMKLSIACRIACWTWLVILVLSTNITHLDWFSYLFLVMLRINLVELINFWLIVSLEDLRMVAVSTWDFILDDLVWCFGKLGSVVWYQQITCKLHKWLLLSVGDSSCVDWLWWNRKLWWWWEWCHLFWCIMGRQRSCDQFEIWWRVYNEGTIKEKTIDSFRGDGIC